MARIAEVVRARGGALLVDEIYLGLSFEPRFDRSALALGDDVIVVNSFSKTFCMTGWRLGWLVLPPALVAPVERLAQNLYICPPALAQHAALACFTPQALAESEARRAEFRQRRDLVVPGLRSLGLDVPVLPDGAFYAWADCTRHLRPGRETSWDFCFEMMRRAQVALTPGRDFGPAAADRHFRLSFANSRPALEEALQRLQQALG
jgi:aspartate/methionine/tyrosine aminotransferase